MLLLAVGLTAATAYLLVWVVNCWTNCKSSRTLPLVLSQEPEDQSIGRLSYEIFIGYRFDSGSLSKQLFWCTSASKALLALVRLYLYSTLPTGILSAAVICRQPPASICALWSTDCSTNQDELQRLQFRRTGTSDMEQSSCWPSSPRHFSRNIQT